MSALAPIVIEQVVPTCRAGARSATGSGSTTTGARVDRRAGADAGAAADVRLTTDYRTAVAIARGKENAQIALARGPAAARRRHRRRWYDGADALAALDDATAALRAATTYPSP